MRDVLLDYGDPLDDCQVLAVTLLNQVTQMVDVKADFGERYVHRQLLEAICPGAWLLGIYGVPR
jgi:hypothetical protein